MDDYSDPKDVLKAVQESGMVIPPQKPEMVHHYPEDDYSVPYEPQRMLKKKSIYFIYFFLFSVRGEGKKGSRHSAEEENWPVPKPQERFRHHTYEEPPDVSPPIRRSETPDSYVGESSDELNGHSPASMSPSPHRQVNYSKDHHSSSPMSSESADDSFPPMHSSSQNHRQQTPQHDRRPTAEYDNPWEWSNNPMKMAKMGPSPEGFEGPRGRSRSELPANRVMRTSPESDTRPGDEYDAPWEWMPMNRKLSQAITDKEKHQHAGRVSPLPETPTRGAKKGNMKLDIKSRPVDMPGEPVDPKIPLTHQTWYHGKLSRSDAEKKLKSCKEGSYLVRQSESAARDYSLSLKSAKGFMHMKIVFNHQSDGYILGEFSKPFPSISEMICYYTRQKLNIRGAEHMALLHPVIDQLL
nr:SH2 domain-containing adapter protein F-like [Lytechinus pictus]